MPKSTHQLEDIEMSTHPITNDSAHTETPAEERPFPLPCNTLELLAPFQWMRLAWQDMKRAPRLSLTYGFVLMLLSVTIGSLTWKFGTLALYLGLATGFVFIGPVLAVGLYSISRQLEMGLQPFMGYCIQQGWRHVRGLLVLGFILLIVMLVWARAAALVSVFVPAEADAGWQGLIPYFAIGSAIGLVFASVVFAASAFSLPMLMDRKVDPVTAVVSSFNAVINNKGAMLVWGGIIGFCVLLGFATGFLSFILCLPLIGHATWHGYRATIDASAYPKNLPGASEDD